jgi:hypothetical protein
MPCADLQNDPRRIKEEDQPQKLPGDFPYGFRPTGPLVVLGLIGHRHSSLIAPVVGAFEK